jgi:hypothetical protein
VLFGSNLKAEDVMGDPASTVRVVLQTESLIRQLSAGKIRLDRALNSTLVRLYGWSSLVLTEGSEDALKQLPGTQSCDLSMDLVGAIAENIICDATALERDLLRKSMEETLFYIVRPDPGLTRSQFQVRFNRFLRHRGLSSLLRMFLSLHLFNIVWFETAKSFRKLAATDELFLRYTRDVERTCSRFVNGCWKSHEIVLPFVDPFPEKLLQDIQERLQEPRTKFCRQCSMKV